MTETKEVKTRAPKTPHHVTIGDKTLSAFARTKAGKAAIQAAGVTVSNSYESASAAKDVVRALRPHIKNDEGVVLRGQADVAPGAEPAAVKETADA